MPSTSVAWKPDANSIVTVLEQNVSIYFPPFQSDKSNSEKGPSRSVKVEKLIIVTPTWQAQPWYPLLLEMSM